MRLAGLEVIDAKTLTEGRQREPFFAADLGVTGVDYLIAETGSVVLRSRPEQPRSLSLLPPVHIAVAQQGQILPDLFDLFPLLLPSPPGGEGLGVRGALSPSPPTPFPQGARGVIDDGLPACLSLITGPSKTGDIELRLVTGVHGPGEIHVIVVQA